MAQVPRNVNDKILKISKEDILVARGIKIESGSERSVWLRLAYNSKFSAGDEVEISTDPDDWKMNKLEIKSDRILLMVDKININWIVAFVKVKFKVLKVNNTNFYENPVELYPDEYFGNIVLKK